MRSFGPPYPTGEWDATFTIGELCNNDDPRGMLAGPRSTTTRTSGMNRTPTIG